MSRSYATSHHPTEEMDWKNKKNIYGQNYRIAGKTKRYKALKHRTYRRHELDFLRKLIDNDSSPEPIMKNSMDWDFYYYLYW